MPRSPRQRSLPGLEPESGFTDPLETMTQPTEIESSGEPVSGALAEPQVPGSTCAPSAAVGRETGGASPDGCQAAAPDVAVEIEGKTVYVLDAFSLLFQVYHALPEMTSPTGESVGAVYGFTRDVLYVMEQKRPDFLFCAFDTPGPTFRSELFADYKINRSAMPDDLGPQIEKARRVLEVLGVPVVECPGFEADDVMATLARICHEKQAQCYVVTNDKDCRQLITDYVRVYNVRKDQVIDAEVLLKEWQIQPGQVVDFQALVGDKVDNIPGVPLIGPRSAAELLNAYGTLEAIFEHAEEIKATQRR